MKNESLQPHKSPPKQLPKETRGFGSARSPCWLRKGQRKWSRCLLRNHHRNTFQRSHVDSGELPALVDLQNVNENGVGDDWEIITETPFKGDAWIQKRSQPLLTQKKSTKQLIQVTCGFVSAPIPCWLRNSQWKLSHSRLRNHHRNQFQRWRVNSLAPAAPVDSEIVNENWVVADSAIITETPFKGDAWIQESLDPL
jgi:hypothetical protein